jgi:hypothetical protein
MKSYHRWLKETRAKAYRDSIPNFDDPSTVLQYRSFISAKLTDPTLLQAAVQYVNRMVKRAPESPQRQRRGNGARGSRLAWR